LAAIQSETLTSGFRFVEMIIGNAHYYHDRWLPLDLLLFTLSYLANVCFYSSCCRIRSANLPYFHSQFDWVYWPIVGVLIFMVAWSLFVATCLQWYLVY